MQILKELVHIVNKNKVRSIEVIGGNGKPGNAENKSMVNEFYEAIIEDKFTNDDEAAQYFYESDSENPNYKKLKNRLKNRLINTVFFIDVKQPSYNQRQRAYYECYKDWAAAKILTGKQARLSSISLSHKILKQAKRYEFSELVLDIARSLRLHYGTIDGDRKRYEQFDQLFDEYEEVWIQENLAEKLYVELVTKYVNVKATQKELHNKAKEAYKRLEPALKKHSSYRLHFMSSLIKVLIYISVNDYKRTIQVCDEAIKFFKQKEYIARLPIQIFLHQQLICHTQLRQFTEGKEVAEECLAFIEEGTFNWFKHKELYFFLSMHSREYQKAYSIFVETTEHRRFQFLPSNIKEVWRIYEAYLQFLVMMKRVDINESDENFSKFKPGKFFNETPIFSKDKRGMNIPILVIQVLFMISQRKYNDAVDRIEAVEKYCSRYLRKDDTFRSNCFIKMLLQIPISGFHKTAVVRKADKYRKQLETVSIDVANQASEIEILPYEDLWNFALECLDNEFHKVKPPKHRSRAEINSIGL
jgi:hypothetical protein